MTVQPIARRSLVIAPGVTNVVRASTTITALARSRRAQGRRAVRPCAGGRPRRPASWGGLAGRSRGSRDRADTQRGSRATLAGRGKRSRATPPPTASQPGKSALVQMAWSALANAKSPRAERPYGSGSSRGSPRDRRQRDPAGGRHRHRRGGAADGGSRLRERARVQLKGSGLRRKATDQGHLAAHPAGRETKEFVAAQGGRSPEPSPSRRTVTGPRSSGSGEDEGEAGYPIAADPRTGHRREALRNEFREPSSARTGLPGRGHGSPCCTKWPGETSR